MFVDALGDAIVIGNCYGYSHSANGINKVRIGIAEKETKSGLLTLQVIKSMKGLYNDIKEDEITSRTASVKPVLLFPVNIDKVQ